MNTINYYFYGKLCTDCDIRLEEQRLDDAYEEYYSQPTPTEGAKK